MVASSEGGEVEPAVALATDSRRPPPKISALRQVVPFVIAAALLVFVGSRIDFGAFVGALAGLDYVSFLAFALVWQIVLLGADALGNYAAYRLTMPNVKLLDFYIFRGASYLPGMVNHHLGQAYLTYLMAKLARVPLARVAGATLVSYAGWIACLVGCMVSALVFTGVLFRYLPFALVAGVAYLIIVHFKPAQLARFALFKPLFEAGVRGHAIALVARIPHLLVLVFGTWASYWFFDVNIPVGTAMLYLPIVLVATTLPLTPQGFGTREALCAAFFVSYAEGSTEAERLGRLTASTTAWGVSITLAGILLGLVCARVVSKRLLALDASAANTSAANTSAANTSRAGRPSA